MNNVQKKKKILFTPFFVETVEGKNQHATLLKFYCVEQQVANTPS